MSSQPLAYNADNVKTVLWNKLNDDKKHLMMTMPDVQSSVDTRQIKIQRVGIKALRYPITVRMTPNNAQTTIGCFNLDVQLPAEQKGAHMSRFIALLEETEEGAPLLIDFCHFCAMLNRMLEKLETSAGQIEVTFPYFIRKTAPVSHVQSLMDYQVTLSGEARDGLQHINLKVCVPVTSLCPCSKEIAQYGAHNQRSQITIAVELDTEMQIETLVKIAEAAASCELWGLLKRPDEKFVTEYAYDHPKFVEDLVREVANRLNQDHRIAAYTVEAENFESIHNHNAYAMIERKRNKWGNESAN